ncbi:MAG: ABC-2 family transporter protein, partial [Nanoarchaeota archaeon]
MISVSKFVTLGAIQLRRDLIYRADFLLSLLVTPTILIVNYFIWKAVFSTGTQTVAGMTFAEMLTYIVLAQLISIFIFNATSNTLQQKVQSGELGQDLLKPIHPFISLLAAALTSRSIALFLEVIPLAVISWFLFKPQIPISAVSIFFVFSLLLALILNFIMSLI